MGRRRVGNEETEGAVPTVTCDSASCLDCSEWETLSTKWTGRLIHICLIRDSKTKY